MAAEISISIEKDLKAGKDLGKLEKAIKEALVEIYPHPLIVKVNDLILAQPAVSVVMTDFGNMEPKLAEQIMQKVANAIVYTLIPTIRQEISVTMHSTLKIVR